MGVSAEGGLGPVEGELHVVRGAFLNVRINAAGLEDKERVAKFIAEGEKLCKLAEEREAKILAIADTKINK